jgi:hypothetical protein
MAKSKKSCAQMMAGHESRIHDNDECHCHPNTSENDNNDLYT